MKRQYCIDVLGQHIGSIWAARMVGEGETGIWLYGGEGIGDAVAVITLRPGITIQEHIISVNAPAATQREDYAIAQDASI